MTKKQRQEAIKSFKAKLASKGWKPDRFDNWLSEDKTRRIHFQPQVWKLQMKVDGAWGTIKAHPINKITDAEAPDQKPVEKPKRAVTRTQQVTKLEAAPECKPLQVKADLSEASMKRIDAMAFKQVQIGSRMDKVESAMEQLVKVVTDMASQVDVQLRRIKSPATVTVAPVFYHKMFNKISLRLRKKSIDVQVEDIHEGVKRRRVFRCSDWTRVEHLMTYRTLTDGIEELELKPKAKRRAPAKKKAVGTSRRRKTIEDTRYEMERDGIKNTELPVPVKPSRAMYNKELAKAMQAQNRNREKAEKVIVKLCSEGGPAEGAKDTELLEALEANGFDKTVAFYAAMNCGRITDPHIIQQHNRRNKKTHAAGQSNQY